MTSIVLCTMYLTIHACIQRQFSSNAVEVKDE